MQEFSDFSFCILKPHLQSCSQNSLNHISLIRWAVIPKRIAGIHDKLIDSVREINEDSAIIRNHGARVRGHIAGFCQGDGIHILAVIGVHYKVIPNADILQQRKHAVVMRAEQCPPVTPTW